MKRNFLFALIMTLGVSTVSARDGVWTVGMVSSHHHNFKTEHRLSGLDNPFGYGLSLGYFLNEFAAFGITGEYFSGDMELGTGEETLWRSSFSAYLFPVQWNRIKPYLSTGLVHTRQNQDFANGMEKTNHLLQMRHGLGLDVMVFAGVHVNLESAIYSDGLNYLGTVNSFGFRYTF
ncbi:hypothetical protein KAR48_15295 [bacterium]|nr:hypothetical protein [bacterium]